MELIEAGIQGIEIAELAGALTDLRPGGGAAARTDKTRLREVIHTCSCIYRRYICCKSQLSLFELTCQNRPVFLVSPFMNFDTNSKTTDIIMFNSRNLGALIVDERPHVREWDEPQFGIQNIGIEESYGFGVLNEGQAIAVAKRRRIRGNERPPPAGGWSSRWVRTTRSSRHCSIWSARSRSASARSVSNALRTESAPPRAAAEFRDRCRPGSGAGLGNPRWPRVFLALGAGPEPVLSRGAEPRQASPLIASSGSLHVVRYGLRRSQIYCRSASLSWI